MTNATDQSGFANNRHIGTVTFTGEPEDSANRKAFVEAIHPRSLIAQLRSEYTPGQCCYHVVNVNMPFVGTVNQIWTEDELNEKLASGQITIDFKL